MKKLLSILLTIGILGSSVYADAALPDNKPLNATNFEFYIYGALIVTLVVTGIIVIMNRKKKGGK